MGSLHRYDGTLPTHRAVPEAQKKAAMFLQRVRSTISQRAFFHLQQIITGSESSNYDSVNHLSAISLLAEIADCLETQQDSDIVRVLESQLEDMSTGSCPQGRTIRLYQIVQAFCGGAGNTEDFILNMESRK